MKRKDFLNREDIPLKYKKKYKSQRRVYYTILMIFLVLIGFFYGNMAVKWFEIGEQQKQVVLKEKQLKQSKKELKKTGDELTLLLTDEEYRVQKLREKYPLVHENESCAIIGDYDEEDASE